MGNLLSSSQDSTIEWLHRLNFNEMLGEYAWRKLHKGTVDCYEQILAAALPKTTTVQPLISYLTNHPVLENKKYWTLLKKFELESDVFQ